MERSLLWSALALGCVGTLCALALIRVRTGSRGWLDLVARPYLVTALAAPLLVFLATLPSRAPFAPGQGFAKGFLLGAAGALLAAALLLRAVRADEEQPLFAPAVVAGPQSLALIAACIPVLWM